MLTIGLTGGVASGKSTVAAALGRKGAIVFEADRIGHEVLDEPTIREELVTHWGRGILGADGRISRPAVADRVFGATAKADSDREFLEQIVHPRIGQRIEAEIRRLPDVSAPAIVIDAALLIESGWNEVCQLTVFVECPRELRLSRAVSRGWTAEEFTRREAAQMPIEQKRQWCDRTIDNTGGLEVLEGEITRFWTAVVGSDAISV